MCGSLAWPQRERDERGLAGRERRGARLSRARGGGGVALASAQPRQATPRGAPRRRLKNGYATPLATPRGRLPRQAPWEASPRRELRRRLPALEASGGVLEASALRLSTPILRLVGGCRRLPRRLGACRRIKRRATELIPRCPGRSSVLLILDRQRQTKWWRLLPRGGYGHGRSFASEW